jgi:hypothetical protein
MTAFHDSVVGLLAIAVGCALVAGAAVESPLLFGLTKSRLLVESFGKIATRWIIAAIGMAAIALGLLIASGWRWHW